MGSLSFLQGIFPTQGSNPGLPLWRQILYQRSHKGSPGMLKWVAYPFSGGWIVYQLSYQGSPIIYEVVYYYFKVDGDHLKMYATNPGDH